MFNDKLITIKEVETTSQLEMIHDYISKAPEHSSFIDGVPNKEDFLEFFLTDASHILYIVEYEGLYVGYGYLEYETPTTGRCHWGLANYTPYFYDIVKSIFEYICLNTELITISAPIAKVNRVAKKIAKRLGYRKAYDIPKYFNGRDFEMWVKINEINLLNL